MNTYWIILLMVSFLVFSAFADEELSNIKLHPSLQHPQEKDSETSDASSFTKLKSFIFPIESDKIISQNSIPAERRQFHHESISSGGYPHSLECNPCDRAPWVPLMPNYGRSIEYLSTSGVDGSYPSIEYLQPPPSNHHQEGQYLASSVQNYAVISPVPSQQPNHIFNSHIPKNLQSLPSVKTYSFTTKLEPLLSNQNYDSQFNTVQRPPKLLALSSQNVHSKAIPQQVSRPNNYFPVPKDYVVPPSRKKQQMSHLLAPPRFIPKLNQQNILPNREYASHFIITGMKPPELNSFITNYAIPIKNPQSNYDSIQSTNRHINNHDLSGLSSVQGLPHNNLQTPIISSLLPSVVPLNNFRAPVSAPEVSYDPVSYIGREYPQLIKANVQLNHSISLPVFDQILKVPKEPIQFPNLYQLPLTPIYNAKDFYSNFKNIPQHDIGATYEESRNREVYNNNQIVNGHQNKGIKTNVVQSNYHINNNQNPINYDSNKKKEGPHDLLSSPNQKEIVKDIQIVQSIPVANFLSSVEHPINLIQSPLVDVTVNPVNQNYGATADSLNKNPIIVTVDNYDNYPSASAQNISYEVIYARNETKDFTTTEVNNDLTEFTPEPVTSNNQYNKDLLRTTLFPVDYTSWKPFSSNSLHTSIMPTFPENSEWTNDVSLAGGRITTEKSKQIQIIVPYTANGKVESKSHLLKGKKTSLYDHLGPKLSLYTQPPTSESVWEYYTEKYETSQSNRITYPDIPKTIINIKDLLKKEADKKLLQDFPFDGANLQKNINDWTEQEYSRKFNRGLNTVNVDTTPSSNLVKKIPNAYLSTNNVTYSITPNFKESKLKGGDDYENNFVIPEVSSTEEYSTTTQYSNEYSHRKAEIPIQTFVGEHSLFSDSSNEKIYVVTPQPLRSGTSTPSTITFSHPPKVDIKSKSVRQFNEDLRLVLSEWPHLINNLETTSTQRSTSIHPLFGLMDLSSYIPPPNSTIQTYSGHSKVITVVTPISLLGKYKITNNTVSSEDPSGATES